MCIQICSKSKAFAETGVISDPSVEVVTVCIGDILDEHVVAHVFEHMLIDVSVDYLHAVDATVVLLDEVFKLERVRAILKETHVLRILNFLLG